MGKILAIAAALAIVVGLAVGYRHIQSERVAREDQTLVQAVQRVARLSTIEMGVSSWQMRKDAKKLFGFLPIRCEKTVAVFYRGRVAAGFDLQPETGEGLAISTTRGKRQMTVRLPAPRILYVDAPAPQVLIADGSICNSLEGSDYEQLHAEARTALQREAVANGILQKAETHARELIRALAEPLGYQADVQIAPPGLPFSATSPAVSRAADSL
jgi:hypothetical protein